ncbi:MAG: V-type ATPase subunit [Candidatus Thermoplasmatota archaeon]|nr:V-type ATPase subunit [Candidatus Thermoplasmatota archaeon]
MVEEILGSIGISGLVLVIVGVALLIVVVLLMSYFKTLVSIANFSYPNAKFRARGSTFVKKDEIEDLLETKSIKEVYSEIRKNGYEIPQEATEDMGEIEKELEESTLEIIKRARNVSPEATKPLVEAWLYRYDGKMVKRATKAIDRGADQKEIMDLLRPVKIIDQDMIDRIASARNKQELFSILNETEFEEILSEVELDSGSFRLDLALDRFAFQKLKEAVMKVESEERASVKYFIGKYTDIFNLKMIFRVLKEDISKKELGSFLLPSGWELKEWKIEDILEAKNLEEALVELEGTSYSDLRQKGASEDPFEVEKVLDQKLLDLASEMSSKYILSVGPLLKYLVAKELELRNLKVLIRGLKEDVPPEKMKDMMILEGN